MPINSTRLGLARFNESERWKQDGTQAGSGFPDGHNDLVDSYDMLAVNRSAHANRPGSGTYDDELWLSTDRRAFYRWENDTSTWNETAGHGTSANPTSDTVFRTTVNTTEVENDDYHEAVTNGSVTGATALDLSASNFFTQTLTGNTEFIFENVSTTPPGNSFYLVVEQDGTGGHTITWPAEVQWPSGATPSLNTSAGATHALTFTSPDANTTWRGTVRGEDFG